jgi:SH3-like domain-containing protein
MTISFIRSLVALFLAPACVMILGTALSPALSPALAENVGVAPADVVRGGSGLPVPRFVSLASDEVNMRTGPGRRYPIRWIYRRKGLPLKVEAEFDIWRKVRDADGEIGWVHGSLLSGRRTAEIRGETRNLYDKQNPASQVVLKAEPGVIGSILECEASWCRLLVAGKKGWIERGGFWGVLPTE